MSRHDNDEATLEQIALLPTLVPNPMLADRTRERCRSLLGHRQRRRHRVVSHIDTVRRGLAAAIVWALCVGVMVYVSALVATAVQLRGVFSVSAAP
ncbi:MAG: hypothetical protein ACT4QD_26630 [Acidobacteriota bacterium]